MQLTGHTIFIAGGTSGIGRGLARRFAASGNTVIVGGRSAATSAELDARDIVLANHPDLDIVVTMSGVMLLEDLRDPAHFAAAESTIDTNVLGTIRVIDAFTPHLIARGSGRFMTVSSGIGFLPFPLMATYAASKAAVHAYSEALRAQLDGTGVGVWELVPPAVATIPEHKKLNPNALDLDDFLDEVLALLGQDPTPNEILVEGVQQHRWAERDGTYAALVTQRSAALANLPGRSANASEKSRTVG
jgi:uncharacterized oxidoreductase